MNKLIAKSTKHTYKNLMRMNQRFFEIFHIFAREHCEHKGFGCNHKFNEHLISIIISRVICKPSNCPFMDGRE